jgi:hypothetical protein
MSPGLGVRFSPYCVNQLQLPTLLYSNRLRLPGLPTRAPSRNPNDYPCFRLVNTSCRKTFCIISSPFPDGVIRYFRHPDNLCNARYNVCSFCVHILLLLIWPFHVSKMSSPLNTTPPPASQAATLTFRPEIANHHICRCAVSKDLYTG